MWRILIWIPTMDDKIHIKFHWLLKNLQIPEGYTVEESYTIRTYIDRARNMLVDKAIKGKYDYLFFLDDDIYPPSDVLVKLVNSWLDIISWVYRERTGDNRLVIYDDIWWDLANRNKINIALWVIQKSLAVWGGCLLIKVDVLKKMREKYWYNIFSMWNIYEYNGKEYLFDKEIEDINKLKTTYVSEDISFGYRAKTLGYNTFIDTRCLCWHLWPNGMVNVDSSYFCQNSKPLVSILLKNNSIINVLNKNMKNNFEYTIIEWDITKETLKDARWKYIMFLDNVQIPYWLDDLMIEWLEEVDIEWPLLIHNGKCIFRNDNIVNNCRMMKKEELIKYLPISSNVPDFTLYRKLKENNCKCGIVNATALLV